MALSDPNREVLRLLTHHVRIASLEQLLTVDVRLTRRGLSQLVRAKLLRKRKLAVGVLKDVGSPLATWSPSRPVPQFGSVAWIGRRRIRSLSSQVTDLYWATRKATRLVGGCGNRLRQPWQVQHDLGVTAVYLQLRRHTPEVAKRWLGEDLYRREHRQRRGEKIADGFILNGIGNVERAIEFVGDYDAQRLESFHDYWSARRTPYELR